MFHFFKAKKVCDILSPVTGTVHPLAECKDGAFASGVLGKGVIFRYEGDCVVAPCRGKVTMVAETNHCVCLTCDNGAELLIHVGFDTVILGSKGLKVLVSKGQRVRAGQKLIEIDREFMDERQVDLTTPMVVMNADEIDLAILCSSGEVDAAGTVIMRCSLKAEG